jgi:hypothetical protein
MRFVLESYQINIVLIIGWTFYFNKSKDDSGDDELKAICLCFYSRTCETDLLLIHARKFQIIDYLNADTSVNLDPEDNTLIIAKLRLIK